MVFATEAFESFNSVIRANSVHSNRQAPSHDIALSFAHINRIRSFLCGGRVRMWRSTKDRELGNNNVDWVPVGGNF